MSNGQYTGVHFMLLHSSVRGVCPYCNRDDICCCSNCVDRCLQTPIALRDVKEEET